MFLLSYHYDNKIDGIELGQTIQSLVRLLVGIFA